MVGVMPEEEAGVPRGLGRGHTGDEKGVGFHETWGGGTWGIVRGLCRGCSQERGSPSHQYLLPSHQDLLPSFPPTPNPHLQ